MRKPLSPGYLVTAFTAVAETAEERTVLVYREDEGVYLEIHGRVVRKKRTVVATDAVMGEIGEKWLKFTEFLSNAGVESVELATPCRPISRASPARGNSPSSAERRALL